ncbi:MAG TPA: TetR/AcrR family transcriptional regulator [Pseudogracilibacillus sp.]|nr:TetR/AcrR family transcriptional regulator [Pseudogracilibacillus sp.]
MPKQTFFNLPKEKKETLVQAAKKEFSRASLADASIANIVKSAKIPRGSFYQYFEGKEDLYFYLLNEQAIARRKVFILILEKHRGDIFAAMKELLYTVLQEIDDDNTCKFYRNVFLNMDYQTEKSFFPSIAPYELDKQFFEIKPLVDTKNLYVNNDEELFQVVQIISMAMMQTIVQKFVMNLSNEEVMKKFELQIKLLKRGFRIN